MLIARKAVRASQKQLNPMIDSKCDARSLSWAQICKTPAIAKCDTQFHTQFEICF